MFVVGRSGNKSLDELVEADPNRRGARLKKETIKSNKEKDVRETQKERERTLRRERARNGGIRRVLVSCYPVCNGEDSRGRAGKHRSISETKVSTMRANETGEARKEEPAAFPTNLRKRIIRSATSRSYSYYLVQKQTER